MNLIARTLVVTATSLALASLFQVAGAQSAVLKATYLFHNGLNAEQTGVPPLIAVDPLGMGGFETTTVFGQTRTVYRFQGEPGCDGYYDEWGNWHCRDARNGGLSLDTTGLIPFNNYSVELVFEFLEENVWRKILDVSDRTDDNGFYVNPAPDPYGQSGGLEVYPYAAGGTIFVTSVFHHVVLTNGADGTVRAYLDGTMEIDLSPSDGVMDIANPARMLHFFLDDAGTRFGEFASGRVALIRIYDGTLSPSEVENLASNPFPFPVSIDIKPGSYPNSINLGSNGNVPVAILSTTDFDATQVDPTTVTLAGAYVRLRGNGTPQYDVRDVNGDGQLDLVVHVSTQALQLTMTDTLAILKGKTFGGASIEGSDTVRVVP